MYTNTPNISNLTESCVRAVPATRHLGILLYVPHLFADDEPAVVRRSCQHRVGCGRVRHSRQPRAAGFRQHHGLRDGTQQRGCVAAEQSQSCPNVVWIASERDGRWRQHLHNRDRQLCCRSSACEIQSGTSNQLFRWVCVSSSVDWPLWIFFVHRLIQLTNLSPRQDCMQCSTRWPASMSCGPWARPLVVRWSWVRSWSASRRSSGQYVWARSRF